MKLAQQVIEVDYVVYYSLLLYLLFAVRLADLKLKFKSNRRLSSSFSLKSALFSQPILLTSNL
jgi:hypothetical protein